MQLPHLCSHTAKYVQLNKKGVVLIVNKYDLDEHGTLKRIVDDQIILNITEYKDHIPSPNLFSLTFNKEDTEMIRNQLKK